MTFAANRRACIRVKLYSSPSRTDASLMHWQFGRRHTVQFAIVRSTCDCQITMAPPAFFKLASHFCRFLHCQQRQQPPVPTPSLLFEFLTFAPKLKYSVRSLNPSKWIYSQINAPRTLTFRSIPCRLEEPLCNRPFRVTSRRPKML